MAQHLDDEAARVRDADRLAALEVKLAKIRPDAQTSSAGQVGKHFDQANLAWRMVIELVAGLVIGFGIGYGLDTLLGTMPIMLVVFVLAGFAAGMKTVVRTSREVGAAAPPARQMSGALARDDEDDDEDEGH